MLMVVSRVLWFAVTVISDFLCKINTNYQSYPPKIQAKGFWMLEVKALVQLLNHKTLLCVSEQTGIE